VQGIQLDSLSGLGDVRGNVVHKAIADGNLGLYVLDLDANSQAFVGYNRVSGYALSQIDSHAVQAGNIG
jgi:hypothetical protein